MKIKRLISLCMALVCIAVMLLMAACTEGTSSPGDNGSTTVPVIVTTATQGGTSSAPTESVGDSDPTADNATTVPTGEVTRPTESVTSAVIEVPTTVSRPTGSYAPEKTSQVTVATTVTTKPVTLPPATTAPTVTLPPPPSTTVPPVTATTTTAKPTTTTTLPKTALTALSPSEYHGYNYVKKQGAVLGEVYLALAAAVEAMDESVDLSAWSINADQLATVFSAYEGDYPQHFWCEHGYGYSMLGSRVVEVSLVYNMSKGERDAARVRFEESVNAVLGKLSGNMSDYEKELRIHDALVNSVDYQHTGSDDDYTAYGALVKKKAVCEGYARAFQYLCYRAGIRCVLISGDSMGVGHMWNVVQIDGEWYQMDVTWDDPVGPEDTDVPYYDYFNVSTKEILRTHGIDAVQLYDIPECTTENGDYFTREGLDMGDRFDSKVVVRALVRFAEEGKSMAQVASTINRKQFTDALMSQFWEIVDAANEQISDPGNRLPNKNASLTYSVNEDTGVIHFFIRRVK